MPTPYETLSTVLNDNLRQVEQLVESDGSMYPHLTKELKARGGAKGQRLMQLTRSALAYDTSIPGNPPNIETTKDGGGIAYVKLPRGKLKAQYGGSPETWANVINLFCALGLLKQKKPGNHSPENNTAAENYSVKVAEEHDNGSRAASWYTFPRYKPQRLARADKRAEAMRGRPARKDAIRDALGDDIANTTTDTRYSIHPETVAQRKALREAIITRIDATGYCYPADAITDALSASEGATRAEIKQTWGAYRETLYDGEGLRYHRPSGADRQQYNLSKGDYIITRRN